MSNPRQLQSTINANPEELHIMSLDEFREIAQKLRTTASDSINPHTAAALVSPAQDILLARALINEVGLTGRAVTKNVNGTTYVILKGYPGLRQKLTGTRYLSTHPKIVDLAIGQKGVNRNLIKGTRLTIYLTVPVNVLQYLLDEEATLTQLIGRTATDLTKIGLATLVGSGAAFAAGAVTTVAAGPLIAAVAVGVATGFTLDYLDGKFGVTNALIAAMETAHDRTIGEVSRQVYRFERSLIERAISRMPGMGGRY
ncbi:hypothetical protein [Marinobacter sp.]|uniref:hypothetical protein n=1 Tax=Marinobacter sp. TaxID=50741 RepID=UPI00384C065D